MTNESNPTQPVEESLEAQVVEVVDTFVNIGRMWASHGLRIGRSALMTSARTLNDTAAVLDGVAQRFEGESDA